ncbi:DUF3021 domain-containing protein [uncultured Microbacterium sp.]|uniref:DUF3021 domain-containing protein n=1 Tax=uncultured Microbacterium sp. TaxID=191216 RepID=UPI0025CD2465|nr:DUF3021 domain-containing protein [uncultured Microbacterium sp.]
MSPIAQAALRGGIPLVIMGGIGSALLFQGQAENGRATLAVAVISAAVAGTSVIYQIDRWSLRRQSILHFAIMAVTVLPALFLSGWFAIDTPAGGLLVISLFLFVGFVLWSSFYLIFRAINARPARASR